jgi:urease accessory protein UreF
MRLPDLRISTVFNTDAHLHRVAQPPAALPMRRSAVHEFDIARAADVQLSNVSVAHEACSRAAHYARRSDANRLEHPQHRVPSTDRSPATRALHRSAWLSGMNFFKRIVQRAKAVRNAVDRGMSTAEYAVGTVAAVAFAAVLYKIVRSSAVQSALSSIIQSALHAI